MSRPGQKLGHFSVTHFQIGFLIGRWSPHFNLSLVKKLWFAVGVVNIPLTPVYFSKIWGNEVQMRLWNFLLLLLFHVCWIMVHFVGRLIASILDFVWPSTWVLKPGYTLICLCGVNLRVTYGAFSSNRGVQCISMYAADPLSGHPSCEYRRAGNSGKQ